MDFTQVEYLTSFASIIYGFAAAEYFHGWGNMVRFKKFSFRFLLWTILGMILMVDIWWGSWIRVTHLSDSIAFFYLSLTTPVVLYMVSVVLFPSGKRVEDVVGSDFMRRRFRKIMILYTIAMISILANNYFSLDTPFFVPERFLIISGGALCLVGALVNTVKVENITLIIGYVLVFAHLIFFNEGFSFEYPEHYTQHEYLIIFIAIIYGYVASVFFLGWGRLIRNFKIQEVHIFHLLWTIFAFLIFVDIWWSTWNKVDKITESILYFYLILIQPFIYYFLAVTLFAVLKDKRVNLKAQFKLASPTIFILFCCVFIFNITLSTIFGEFGLFHSKNIIRFCAIIFGAIAIFKHSRFYQISILTIAFILYIVHLWVDELRHLV